MNKHIPLHRQRRLPRVRIDTDKDYAYQYRGYEQNYTQYHSKHYVIRPEKLEGAAPKNVVSLYRYKAGNRTQNQKWKICIVKTGNKAYPVESITEHLCTEIGKTLQFNMAHTFLGIFRGQIKIASEYFLRRNSDELIKGAQIYCKVHNLTKKRTS